MVWEAVRDTEGSREVVVLEEFLLVMENVEAQDCRVE